MERGRTCLFDDVDAVLKLLSLQEWMHVEQERAQVTGAVAVRDDERHSVT